MAGQIVCAGTALEPLAADVDDVEALVVHVRAHRAKALHVHQVVQVARHEELGQCAGPARARAAVLTGRRDVDGPALRQDLVVADTQADALCARDGEAGLAAEEHVVHAHHVERVHVGRETLREVFAVITTGEEKHGAHGVKRAIVHPLRQPHNTRGPVWGLTCAGHLARVAAQDEDGALVTLAAAAGHKQVCQLSALLEVVRQQVQSLLDHSEAAARIPRSP
mmetsp:Transcript_5096/g.15054  ORF Transcript_5096/g.15054 Transcript_5096/m.15054 type:complete len:223 (+) Transcript_5096:2183-2851(+)